MLFFCLLLLKSHYKKFIYYSLENGASSGILLTYWGRVEVQFPLLYWGIGWGWGEIWGVGSRSGMGRETHLSSASLRSLIIR